jgi:hypothetical protein
MACSVPICYLLHRTAPDGTAGLLMEPDLPSALADAARGQGDGSWHAECVTIGRETVLQGEALQAAIVDMMERSSPRVVQERAHAWRGPDGTL